jgi:hypothetical protein
MRPVTGLSPFPACHECQTFKRWTSCSFFSKAPCRGGINFPLAHQVLLDAGIVDLDDRLQRLHVRKPDVVEEAAAQEGVGQFLLVVRGDDDDRPVSWRGPSRRSRRRRTPSGRVPATGRWELDIGLVDLVDQQNGLPVGASNASQSLPRLM